MEESNITAVNEVIEILSKSGDRLHSEESHRIAELHRTDFRAAQQAKPFPWLWSVAERLSAGEKFVTKEFLETYYPHHVLKREVCPFEAEASLEHVPIDPHQSLIHDRSVALYSGRIAHHYGYVTYANAYTTERRISVTDVKAQYWGEKEYETSQSLRRDREYRWKQESPRHIMAGDRMRCLCHDRFCDTPWFNDRYTPSRTSYQRLCYFKIAWERTMEFPLPLLIEERIRSFLPMSQMRIELMDPWIFTRMTRCRSQRPDLLFWAMLRLKYMPTSIIQHMYIHDLDYELTVAPVRCFSGHVPNRAVMPLDANEMLWIAYPMLAFVLYVQSLIKPELAGNLVPFETGHLDNEPFMWWGTLAIMLRDLRAASDAGNHVAPLPLVANRMTYPYIALANLPGQRRWLCYSPCLHARLGRVSNHVIFPVNFTTEETYVAVRFPYSQRIQGELVKRYGRLCVYRTYGAGSAHDYVYIVTNPQCFEVKVQMYYFVYGFSAGYQFAEAQESPTAPQILNVIDKALPMVFFNSIAAFEKAVRKKHTTYRDCKEELPWSRAKLPGEGERNKKKKTPTEFGSPN